jgi:hypothetical protein
MGYQNSFYESDLNMTGCPKLYQARRIVLTYLKDMKIIQTYTGNALLNNALMTIEALAGLNNVDEITSDVLLVLFEKRNLTKLSQRLKSYTMLFTKNGPLHNDKEFGERIYKSLMLTILQNVEAEGSFTCELSGLKFKTSFEQHFANALKSAGYPADKIKGKDKTINRCWFPLIGGLGSDAQALPQAKFAISIHPVFVAILQFLPLSSVIYKGGILLVDSINFEFARDFVADNVKRVQQQIELTSSGQQIENIKDYSKGHYLLTALRILNDKRDWDDEYSDLNLWSFSNSGTGASCEIDRVPNRLFQKLRKFKSMPDCEIELTQILTNGKFSNFFLERLSANLDYPFLYRSKNSDSVTVPFYETYQVLTGNDKYLEYAQYFAYVINKYKTKPYEKLLEKSDATSEDDYRVMFFATALMATQNKEWSLKHHISILNEPNILPVQSKTWKIYQMVHYYYDKREAFWQTTAPAPTSNASESYKLCLFVANLIEQDERTKTLRKDLTNPQETLNVNLFPLFTRCVDKLSLSMVEQIIFKDGRQDKFGLLELLRLYFVQGEAQKTDVEFSLPGNSNAFWDKYIEFSEDYQTYYFEKYTNPDTKKLPLGKYEKLILNTFPEDSEGFIRWFNNALEKRSEYKKEENKTDWKDWDDDLLYNQHGERAVPIARFAIQFSLNKTFNDFKQLQTV